MTKHDQDQVKRYRRMLRWKRALGGLSALVVSVTTYALILPALTTSTQTWCGVEEHTHSQNCYEQRLVCTQQSDADDSGHIHTEECYQDFLVCSQTVHIHEDLCYSNPDAVQTREQWELCLPLQERSGVWAEDLLLIAESQLGNRESEENFDLIDGRRRGYTCYGDWSGSRYGDWCASFASFCLSYADIPASIVPYGSDAAQWAQDLQAQGLYRDRAQEDQQDYQPKTGDLVFLAAPEADSDTPARVGIVKSVTGFGDNALLYTVEGDAEGKVANCGYALNAEAILGFAELPERPEWLAAFQTPAEPMPTEPSAPEAEDDRISAPDLGLIDRIHSAEQEALRFQGEDYEILLHQSQESQLPDQARLEVQELDRGSVDYLLHAAAVAQQMPAHQALKDARFFDIRLLDAQGEEILFADGSGLAVEIRLQEQTVLDPSDCLHIVHFNGEEPILVSPQDTKLSQEGALASVRFRAEGFSVWGVVTAKTYQDLTLTAQAQGVEISMELPAQARIPEDASLQARELLLGSEEYELCRTEALRLLSEDAGEPAQISFARFFDLTILDAEGRELEPEAAVQVRFDYEEDFQLTLGQTMYVVHFAEEGTELIETELSRPVDEQGQELEGTSVQFSQGSFSITGTVLTGDDLVNNGSIYDGFPKEAAAYYVTFDAEVNGVTKTYAMAYGGIVEEVTRNADGSITFKSGVSLIKDVADEWFNSFVWYYNNNATIHGNTNYANFDYFGNFLSNDAPFADMAANGYKGGIQTLTVSENGLSSDGTWYDSRNRLRSYNYTDWDYQNYDHNSGNNLRAKYGPMGGWSTFVVIDGNNPLLLYYLNQMETIYRPARSLYITENGEIRLAMRTNAINSSKTAEPVKAENKTLTSWTIDRYGYAKCDAILVLNRDSENDPYYWGWVYPYEIGAGKKYPNAIVATNMQFSNGYTTDGLAPAQPGNPMASILNGYKLDAPEISKSLMPNRGGDGTYSLSLSVLGNNHASYTDIVADVLIVADMSNSMTEKDGGTRTRFEILKSALESLKHTLLGRNEGGNNAIAINMMTFRSIAQDYDGYNGMTRPWVSTGDAFQSYIDALPYPDNTYLGATNWEDALDKAYDMLKNRRDATASDTKKHVQYLIFLTDGDPTAWMYPYENEMLNAHDWIWDYHPYIAEDYPYHGTGSTQPLNVYYALLEARDNAREIVWGLEKGTGIQDAYSNTHVNADGETEEVATYFYTVATMGNADTLTNLLAYAYNGSLEATYPEDTFLHAKNQEQLESAFRVIADSINSTAGYTEVSIYDPFTEYTHLAPEMDHTEGAFQYYRYRCNENYDILDDEGQVRYQAVRNANRVVTHYRDVQNGNAEIWNIYEQLEPWDLETKVAGKDGQVTVNVKPAEFDIKIYRKADGVEVTLDDLNEAFENSGASDWGDWIGEFVAPDEDLARPDGYWYNQVLTWDLETVDPYTDPTGEPSNQIPLEKGYAYAVVTTVWPYQEMYDYVALLNNGEVTLEELSALGVDTKYIEMDADGLYYYYTNLQDDAGASKAYVSYKQYQEVGEPGEEGYKWILSDAQRQRFINPDAMPLQDTALRIRKNWVDAVDGVQLKKLIEDAVNEVLKEKGKAPLSQMTWDTLKNDPSLVEELRKAYSVEIGLIMAPYGAEYSGTWTCDLMPEWHFYGEKPGEDPSLPLSIEVDESFSDHEVSLGVGILISKSKATFDPNNSDAERYGPVELELYHDADDPVRYYMLELGFDYTLLEIDPDPLSIFSSATCHPMLIDGTLHNIEIFEVVGKEGGDRSYYKAYDLGEMNENYRLEATNRLITLDVELKKIDSNTDTKTAALSDATAPKGTGEMYDDQQMPGLPGAEFQLYSPVEPVVAEADMAGQNVVWLKKDGSIEAKGAKPAEDAIQVRLAEDVAGQPLNPPATDKDGKIRFQRLLPGTYYLVETKAPAGYQEAASYLTLTLTADGLIYIQPGVEGDKPQSALGRIEVGSDPVGQPVYEILVRNTLPGVELPHTGGSGRTPIVILGILLILIGGTALLIRNTRGKKAGARL